MVAIQGAHPPLSAIKLETLNLTYRAHDGGLDRPRPTSRPLTGVAASTPPPFPLGGQRRPGAIAGKAQAPIARAQYRRRSPRCQCLKMRPPLRDDPHRVGCTPAKPAMRQTCSPGGRKPSMKGGLELPQFPLCSTSCALIMASRPGPVNVSLMENSIRIANTTRRALVQPDYGF